MSADKLAIFIDVENLAFWVKENGIERLLTELSAIGSIIVRRAYGNWLNLHTLQPLLISLGFELVHTYQPVKKKNSTDIRMCVDIMEYALKIRDINWFVLATGDSDFSPLFRRLREMGKYVIGVGPKSPLSESVKASCSRFIYIGKEESGEALIYRKEDAIEVIESILKQFEGPVLCSLLKDRILNLDSAFNERKFGYKSFVEFLKSIDALNVSYDQERNLWFVSLRSEREQLNLNRINFEKDKEQVYRRLLKKNGWRLIPKDLLIKIYNIATELPFMAREELVNSVLEKSQYEDITTTDIRKAFEILFKSRLVEADSFGETRKYKILFKDNFLKQVDKSIINYLLRAIEAQKIPLDIEALSNILYENYTNTELENIINMISVDEEL